MTCNKCGKDHKSKDHAKLVSSLSDKGFPKNDSRYPSAHEKADKAEKKRFGAKSYNELKKIDEKLQPHELAGKNLKSGKIEVSKKIPSKYRKEIAYHEKIENRNLRKK